MTPSQARNAIKKSLKAVVDPKPNKEDKGKIWKYFKDECAYCGRSLDPKSRLGHIDHLYPEMDGGSNRLSNLVLTCSICNGDEKRESAWEEFLAFKNMDNSEILARRKSRILEWIELNGKDPMLSDEELVLIAREFERINKVFTESITTLRRNSLCVK